MARNVIDLQYVGLEVSDKHRSECPVFVFFAEKGNYTRNSKITLTGLIRLIKPYNILFADIDYKNCCFTIYFSDKNVV